MKHPLAIASCFIALSVATAQGVFNANNNYTPAGSNEKAFVWVHYNRVPLDKAVGRVRIRDAVSLNILSPGGKEGVPLALNGIFFINYIVVPGVPIGGTANVILEAWNSPESWPNDQSIGSVPITVSDLGGGSVPPATLRENSNFVGLHADMWGPSAKSVVLTSPHQKPDGQWIVRVDSDGSLYASLFVSTNLTHWDYVIGYFVYHPRLNYEFPISPPGNSPQYFRILPGIFFPGTTFMGGQE